MLSKADAQNGADSFNPHTQQDEPAEGENRSANAGSDDFPHDLDRTKSAEEDHQKDWSENSLQGSETSEIPSDSSQPGAPKRSTVQSPARSLLHNALRLFGRLSSEILNECELWYLYAKLNLAREDASCAVELRKTLKYVTRAHACLLRDQQNLREKAGRKRIAEVGEMWSGVVNDLANVKPPLSDRRQMVASAKLTLRSSLVAMEKHGGEGEDEEVERVRSALNTVEALLSETQG